jgi:CBS domain-containing protein
MTISEVMSAGVHTVRPGTPAANARERMRTKQIHHLLVQEGTQLVGVLSARDLARRDNRGKAIKKLLVADFMTPHVVTVTPDTSLHRAANVMRGRSIGCLIVIDEGRAVGIVTVADLLDQVRSRPRHRIDRRTPADLHYRAPHKKQHRAGRAW